MMKKVINNTFSNFDEWLNVVPYISNNLEYLKINGAYLTGIT